MKPQYERMARYLWLSGRDTVRLSFDEIENIISGNLPANTRASDTSWSNNPGGFGMTPMWLAAGYKRSDLDLTGEQVTFKRVNQKVSDTCWRKVIRLALNVDLPTR
ncbi:MAG: hypothetical protein F4X11_14675 [Acidobacteria bacterium]|nr:hypothetical protein [Acidobacteriota bacterium]